LPFLYPPMDGPSLQARPAPGHPWKIGSRPRPREPNQKSSYRYLPEKTASVQSFCVMNRRTILQGALFTLGASTIERSLVARAAGLSRGAFSSLLSSLDSPVLFAGDSTNAYRDPAAIYHRGWLYLY